MPEENKKYKVLKLTSKFYNLATKNKVVYVTGDLEKEIIENTCNLWLQEIDDGNELTGNSVKYKIQEYIPLATQIAPQAHLIRVEPVIATRNS